MNNKIYKNSTELAQLAGTPIYMDDVAKACLYGRLNLFLVGDTGSGKTQLARDAMSYFGDKSMFILGRNDMDTRELFQQINLEKLRTANSTSEIKELTDKVNNNLSVVDELPNCVPEVRAQLFNLFDGFIEINGKAYPIGGDYSVGIATGNLGQKFTESSNDLGRALKDRMHIIVDVDYFHPTPSDTLEILSNNTNPRVEFNQKAENKIGDIVSKYKKVSSAEIPFEKLIIANYLVHGLDYCSKGSKRKMKEAWPNEIESHEQGSDASLILPLSMRAAKSTIRLSQAFDEVVKEKSNTAVKPLESMMQAYRFVAPYSGVLNEAAVQGVHEGSKYKAIDAVITSTNGQFQQQNENIAAGLEMVRKGKTNSEVLNMFTGRWEFMKDILTKLTEKQKYAQNK